MTVSLAAFSLGACSGGYESAEQVVRDFLDYSIAGDAEAARACLAADERMPGAFQFTVSPEAAYTIGTGFREEDQSIVPVHFVGEDEMMNFVVVDDGDGYRVSLALTLARGMTHAVQQQIESLGDGATHEEIVEAMRRGMNAAPSGR